MNIDIKILDQRLHEFPMQYSSLFSAGLDVRACIPEKLTLYPGDVKLIPLGFAMQMGRKDVAALLMPRSGLGHKNGIVLGNLVGVIDVDYTGQCMASLWNRHSNQEFHIQPMDRIAQMLIVPVIRAEFNIVEEFPETIRGAGGFNSTGVL